MSTRRWLYLFVALVLIALVVAQIFTIRYAQDTRDQVDDHAARIATLHDEVVKMRLELNGIEQRLNTSKFYGLP